MTDTAPQHGPPTDVAVDRPPIPDLSLPPGAIACSRGGKPISASDAKAVRDFAVFLEQQQGKPPPTAAEPLPPACMNGTCACPPQPDGADQHLDARVDALHGPGAAAAIDAAYADGSLFSDACTRPGCGRPKAEHELDGTFCP